MRRLKKAAGALNTAGVDTVQQKPISRLNPLAVGSGLLHSKFKFAGQKHFFYIL